MRFAALLIVSLGLATAGCNDVKKEIDKPGPAPPYDPKAAELDPSLVRPATPTVSPENDTPDAERDKRAEEESK